MGDIPIILLGIRLIIGRSALIFNELLVNKNEFIASNRKLLIWYYNFKSFYFALNNGSSPP